MRVYLPAFLSITNSLGIPYYHRLKNVLVQAFAGGIAQPQPAVVLYVRLQAAVFRLLVLD